MKTLTRNILRTAITVILVILAFVAIFRAWVYYTASPWTRDARFSADIVAIAPDVSGLISQVNVKDNQLVKKDQVLFVIDQPRYQKALAQAELARTGEEHTEENAGFKAQCVSYILGKEFGVDVSGYAFEAPADFLRTDDPQEIRAELSEIRDTAYDISARMARSLEQNKAPRHTEQER